MTGPDPISSQDAASTPPAPPPAAPGTDVYEADPANRAQPGLVAGVILVVVGAVVLLGRLVELNLDAGAWPLWIVVPGLAMLVGSIFIPRAAVWGSPFRVPL
jgi:hypothetical protein